MPALYCTNTRSITQRKTETRRVPASMQQKSQTDDLAKHARVKDMELSGIPTNLVELETKTPASNQWRVIMLHRVVCLFNKNNLLV